MKCDKIKAIVIEDQGKEVEFFSILSIGKDFCATEGISLERLIAIRDYIQLMVEKRTYENVTQPMFKDYKEKHYVGSGHPSACMCDECC